MDDACIDDRYVSTIYGHAVFDRISRIISGNSGRLRYCQKSVLFCSGVGDCRDRWSDASTGKSGFCDTGKTTVEGTDPNLALR